MSWVMVRPLGGCSEDSGYAVRYGRTPLYRAALNRNVEAVHL